MYNAYQEIKARDAYILVITEITDLKIDYNNTDILVFPNNYYQPIPLFSLVFLENPVKHNSRFSSRD